MGSTVERVDGSLGHLGKGRLLLVLGLLDTVDLIAQVAVVEQADVRETDVTETVLEGIELGAVLGNVVALLLSEAKQVDVVITARAGVGVGLEVAATTTEKNIDTLVKRVVVTNLLGSNTAEVVAVEDVRRVSCRCVS